MRKLKGNITKAVKMRERLMTHRHMVRDKYGHDKQAAHKMKELESTVADQKLALKKAREREDKTARRLMKNTRRIRG